MYLAKSIDELYEEVKDYDLVMCNDAPLALALNNRLDRPRVGVFAITPQQLALDMGMDTLGRPIMSDIEVVRKLSNYSDSPMRFIHGEVENFKTIRKYTKDIKHYLRGRSRYIYDDYVRLPTLEKAMVEFSGDKNPYFKGKKIAVIGGELYDDLDKQINPPAGTFTEIDLFKKEWEDAYPIPEFREMYNDHQIAENAVELIDEKKACDYAIVLDVNGKIADAVRSELYRRGISFINKLSIKDLNDIRDFIEFVRRSLDFRTTKVSQIRELLHTYKGTVISKYDEYLIENYPEFVKDRKALDLLALMKRISDNAKDKDVEYPTYGEVCDEILGKDGAQVKLLLNQLEITGKKVNISDTADMIYSVNNFELKHNEQIPKTEKEGVLLVDCKNSVYIDRPVVIYLGLGPEWERDLSDLNLIDYKLKDSIIDRDVTKFQILLQQGTSRIYICNSMKNGKKTKPCSYFEKAERPDKPYETFSDIARCVPGPWYRFKEKEHEDIGIESISKELKDFSFSNTSFKQFITCPRKFMFGKVIDSPDGEHTELGECLHHYAEFRAAFPDKARELGQEFFVREISSRCTPLFSPELRRIRESKIRSAVSELDWLIETRGLSEGINLIEKERKHENMFFHLVEADGKGSDCSEVQIIDVDRHMNGKLDVIKGDHVYDFKTGTPKTSAGIAEDMSLNKDSAYGKDMQCLFYLSLMMEKGIKWPSFTFFSTSANEKNNALGLERDTEAAFVNVVLVKDKAEIMRRVFPYRLMEKGDKYDVFKGDCDQIMDIVEDIGLENMMSDHEGAISRIIDELGLKDTKTVKDGANVLLNIIDDMQVEYYKDRNTIYVTLDEMERFRALVNESYVKVSEMYNDKFPAKPLMKCEYCEFKDMCMSAGGDADE